MNRGNAGKGRPKGSKNKVSLIVAEKIAAYGCDPFKVLADIANGNAECGVCRGKGKSKWQPLRGELVIKERICESCYGSGKERVSPGERGKAAAELAQYIEPKRKAIEHSGPGGGPVPVSLTVVFDDEPHTNGHA